MRIRILSLNDFGTGRVLGGLDPPRPGRRCVSTVLPRLTPLKGLRPVPKFLKDNILGISGEPREPGEPQGAPGSPSPRDPGEPWRPQRYPRVNAGSTDCAEPL